MIDMFPFIPTCGDAMSEFTYFALCSIVGSATVGAGAVIWWVRREVSRIDHRIDNHDIFMNDTKEVLTRVQVDISSIKANILSIEHSMGELAKSNRDMTKYMLENK